VIQCSPEITDDVASNVEADIGHLLDYAHFVHDVLGLIRVRLSKHFVEVFVAYPSRDFPFEIGEAMLCPCDLAARALKGV
jgi:hypothetical protein